MIQLVVEQTNLYSVQKRGQSICVTKEVVEKFIGIYLLLGIVDMPTIRSYWQNESRFPAIADMMSKNRVETLQRYLHFEDNVSGTEVQKKDTLWKLRTWILLLRVAVELTEPEEFHSVDEMMVSFTGRCCVKQHLAGKRTPWGIMLWGRAGASCVLYYFYVYQGHCGIKYKFRLGGDVVIGMCKDLPSHHGHKIAADNFLRLLI